MKKQWAVLVSVALLLVPSLAFANGKAETSTVQEKDNTPTKIVWMMYGDNTPTEKNSVLNAINKKFNVDLSIIYVPEKDYSNKLNTLIAAHTLPDIFWVNGNVLDTTQLRDAGLVRKLDDLLPSYGQNILREVGTELKKTPVNQKDGIYAIIPGSLNYTSNLSIRTDWLANLNLSMPTDLDSFHEVLKAFTYGDPDKDGKDDTVGYVGTMASMRTFETIFGAYGICVDKPYLMDDGTVTTWMKAPQYLSAIKYLRTLYQEGLMDPDFATIPLMSSFEKLWTGKTGAFDFQDVGTTNNWMPGRYTEKPVPTFGFTVLTGPEGKSGAIKQYPRYAWQHLISSNCKHPEVALALIDYMYSEEGDELTYLGIEGKHYKWIDKENGKYELLGEYKDPMVGRADGVFVYNKMLPLLNTEVRTMNKQTQDGQTYAREHSLAYPFIIKQLEANKKYGSALSDITKEAFAQLIVSTGDIEKEYQAFVERWNNEGGLAYEKEATATYKAQLAAEK